MATIEQRVPEGAEAACKRLARERAELQRELDQFKQRYEKLSQRASGYKSNLKHTQRRITELSTQLRLALATVQKLASGGVSNVQATDGDGTSR